ncbi:hypothetical protein DFP94_10454 [Fontibacillus phaseoli]|uniref:Uncharacterized protein n=1 Tax=Fontibacillus phaseoli TaxID=1416533 RepID=A0A369BDH5_9BACL|nr:hypothetical protein DFP94_10454 [Fontibacillus phaseoli]
MKIGEGLLVAEKQGSQYRFTEEDSGDLEEIRNRSGSSN